MVKLTVRKLLIFGLVGIILSVAGYFSAQAITMLYKQVTGSGNVEYSDQTTVSQVVVQGADKIKVSLVSTATTVASHVYTVELYLDGNDTATQTVNWTAGQIPGTTKSVTFAGLSLAGVTDYSVEVRY